MISLRRPRSFLALLLAGAVWGGRPSVSAAGDKIQFSSSSASSPLTVPQAEHEDKDATAPFSFHSTSNPGDDMAPMMLPPPPAAAPRDSNRGSRNSDYDPISGRAWPDPHSTNPDGSPDNRYGPADYNSNRWSMQSGWSQGTSRSLISPGDARFGTSDDPSDPNFDSFSPSSKHDRQNGSSLFNRADKGDKSRLGRSDDSLFSQFFGSQKGSQADSTRDDQGKDPLKADPAYSNSKSSQSSSLFPNLTSEDSMYPRDSLSPASPASADSLTARTSLRRDTGPMGGVTDQRAWGSLHLEGSSGPQQNSKPPPPSAPKPPRQEPGINLQFPKRPGSPF